MKTQFLIAISTLMLGGCSLLTAYEYDNNEYEILARLETSIKFINDACDDSDTVKQLLPALQYDANLLNTYTFYIPRNTDVFEISEILKQDVQEFKKQYDDNKDTPTYCKLKSQTFLKKVQTTLQAVANKSRSR